MGQSGQVFETDARAGLGSLVVKLFTWGAGLPEPLVRDFTREAMTVASLRHPHVAAVVDAGTLADGTPFVVMERLAGMTLEEAASGRPLPITEILPIIRGVASALSAAHAAGIAHGEVRADNLFLAEGTGYGWVCPKLLDFGVARLVGGARAIGRDAGDAAPGSAAQLELGGRAGERADQRALATLVWRLSGGTAAPAIERVLLRAMSPDPSQRFGAVTALVEALEEAFVNATAGVAARNAADVTTLVGAPVPVSVSRPVVVVAASRLADARPRSSGPTSVIASAPSSLGIASAPSSLTQQFFAEGDQLEIAHGAAQTDETGSDADDSDEGELEPAVATRVPRSRAQMISAALLALGSVAVIGWTVVSLASKPASGPQGSELSPLATAVRQAAIPAPGAPVPTGAIERGPARTAVVVGRASRARSLPSAAPEKAAVTVVATPASSHRAATPTSLPAVPAAGLPSAPSTPAAVPAAVAAIEAPPPLASGPPAEAVAGTSDRSTPGAPPGAPSNDLVAQPGDQAGGESSHAAPTPTVPDDGAQAPGEPDDAPPATAAPESPTPSVPQTAR